MTATKPAFIERCRAIRAEHERRLQAGEDCPVLLPVFWKCRQCGKEIAPDSTDYREGVLGSWLTPFYCRLDCFVYGPHADHCECAVCGPASQRLAEYDRLKPRYEQHGLTMLAYGVAEARRIVRERNTLAFLASLGI